LEEHDIFTLLICTARAVATLGAWEAARNRSSLYPELKTLHVLCAAASLLLFVVRGGYMLLLSRGLQARIWRWLPPMVDTLLLTFGGLAGGFTAY